MKEIIMDTLLDIGKLIPFLFIAFLIIELIEHKFTDKGKQIIKNTKFGPLVGGLLGMIPQCGFSVVATNFYITRVITLGTLFAIYLSTSDEMLPILLSEGGNIKVIIAILLIKFIIGLIAGFTIDFFYKEKNNEKYDICEKDHCHCEHGIIKSSIIHTLKTAFYLLLITFILDSLFEFMGEEMITNSLLNHSFIAPFITSLIGLIPNCGSSVILTELYLNNVITLGACIGGLLTNSGVALLVLFKSNENIKKKLSIIGLLYAIGIICGIMVSLVGGLLW